MQDYERVGIISVSSILYLIPRKPKERCVRTFFGHKVSLASKRLRVFAIKGIACVICGISGKYFAIERHKDTGYSTENKKEVKFRPHLYAVDTCGVDEVMLTIDHIHPKAKGGKNSFNNLQTMCEHCNFHKGDIVL